MTYAQWWALEAFVWLTFLWRGKGLMVAWANFYLAIVLAMIAFVNLFTPILK